MDDISVNRNDLRRLLIDYCRLRAADAARIALLNRGRIGSPGASPEESLRRLQAARNFMKEFTEESERQREQNRHLECSVLDALDDQDADAFRHQLQMLVPPKRDSEE